MCPSRRPGRPHCTTREGPVRGTYVRIGATNRRADAELVEELRRFAWGEGFDEQPMLAPVRRLSRRDLENLRRRRSRTVDRTEIRALTSGSTKPTTPSPSSSASRAAFATTRRRPSSASAKSTASESRRLALRRREARLLEPRRHTDQGHARRGARQRRAARRGHGAGAADATERFTGTVQRKPVSNWLTFLAVLDTESG